MSLCLYSNLYGKFENFDSTISHIGFILLALAISTEQSIESFIFYIIQYSITNLNTFLILIALSYVIYNTSIKKNIDKIINNNNMSIFYIILETIKSKTSNLDLIKMVNLLKFIPDSIYSYKDLNIKNLKQEINKELINTDIKYISELKGQFFQNPLLSLSLSICLFSMAGINEVCLL